tara:strand:- start:624 stop:1115 length:492 start_codon:yes stop_codon:yes gene_type:complete
MFKLFFNVYFLFFCLGVNLQKTYAAEYIDKGHYIIDLKNRVEWLKCSVGQRWDEQKCIGDPVKISLEEAVYIKSQVGDELGGIWRLPNKSELLSIVCDKCATEYSRAKINNTIFPNTPAEIFWTSSRNWWSPKFFWSVNFITGHAYGRFVPEKKLFVRFVRDR